MDNFYFIDRLIQSLKKKLKTNIIEQIEIFNEYKIPLSKNRRVDYILKYGHNILLVEFRISQDFPNTSNIWQKKELELIVYKELMSNFIPKNISMILYAFIGMPEYNGNEQIVKHKKYNTDNLEHLAEYVCQYLIRDDLQQT